MTHEVPRADDIRKAAETLLRAADAKGRLPTPVDDIIAAAGLVEPEHSLLSDSVLAQAPAHLRDKIRKLRLKVRAVLDRDAREIHIDPDLRIRGQIAFKKLHEVGHDICWWQRDRGYADDDETLSWSMDQRLEREANQAAAELLFQRKFFQDAAAQYEIGIASILDLAELIGSSGHAAFRRFIETHRWALAGVVMDGSPRSRIPLRTSGAKSSAPPRGKSALARRTAGHRCCSRCRTRSSPGARRPRGCGRSSATRSGSPTCATSKST